LGENPKPIYVFKTEHAWFTCKAKDIPLKLQSAVDTGGAAKAEVGTEPDADDLIQFIRFVADE
jgi:hypothetical protein